MKYALTCYFACFACGLFFMSLRAQPSNHELFDQLDQAIDSVGSYDTHLQHNIDATRLRPALNDYERSLRLYEAFKILNFDSAFAYAKRLERFALDANDPHRLAEARLKIAFVLLSAGMYKETEEIMNEIPIRDRPDDLRAEYYLLKGRFYYDLADYTNDAFFYPGYFRQGGESLDSALSLIPHDSFNFIYYTGLKQIKLGALDGAFINLQQLMSRPGLTDHQLALAASTLSYIFFRKGITDSVISYQARAAIADIHSSTKETFAILNLAQILYGQHDFARASRYIRKAVDDATQYGSRHRKMQLSTIVPIIQGGEITYVKQQRRSWIIYASIVSVFLLLFAAMLFIIRKQNQKLRKTRQAISDAHEKLHAVNTQLIGVNTQLQLVNADIVDVNTRLEEANRIKEEYVGYFFSLDTDFFQKIDRFTKSIEEKIHYGKFNEIKHIVNSIRIKDEKHDLIKRFDKVFLRLFPHFIDEFNSLFNPEHQVRLESGELLNTDLRIYALLRLGIRENEKIAEILEYSVKSIYAYKSRIRNRSRVPKEEFDKRVMKIRSVSGSASRMPLSTS